LLISRPSSTRSGEGIVPTPRQENEPNGLAEWQATQEAKELEGRWVLLTHDYEVIDHASKPSELFDRHPDIDTPFIVFVKPSNAIFVG
jgi:hypothetical protein